MCGIPCKVFLVRHAAIRGVGVGGVHRMPLPRRSPGPTDPITASPAPHHTMHLTPALAPCRGTLSDHLLHETLSGALRGPLQPHLCHLGRAVYPPLFFPLPRRSQTRPSRALICASISSADLSVVSLVSTRSTNMPRCLPISSRFLVLTAGGISSTVPSA